MPHFEPILDPFLDFARFYRFQRYTRKTEILFIFITSQLSCFSYFSFEQKQFYIKSDEESNTVVKILVDLCFWANKIICHSKIFLTLPLSQTSMSLQNGLLKNKKK